MRIDSHQHFWSYSHEEYDWIDDSMSVLKQDYLPSHLSPNLEASQIQKSVAVQARTTDHETEWLLSLAKENPPIAGVVGWIDLKSDDLENKLKQYKNEEKLVGFREILQAESLNFMLEEKFIAGLKLLHHYNYTYDILVFPKHLKAVSQLIKKLPEQRLVIDHIAKPEIASHSMNEWASDMKEIAQHKHIYIKLSGMVTEANESWTENDILPYMQVVFDCFGEDRILFGSDWPVCLLRANYTEVYNLALNFIKKQSSTAEDKVFGLNASNFYQLSTGVSQ